MKDVALILAAHGDRGSAERNRVLRGHAEALRMRGAAGTVSYGVLNGEPPLAEALRYAAAMGASRIVVYPFFMSDGYFVRKVLPERIAEAGVSAPVEVRAPLGLDEALPSLLLLRALAAARGAGFDAASSRLLIAGHGSKFGRASADATNALAAKASSQNRFGKVATAFLEEAPFLEEALSDDRTPTVVAGFFSGEGMHGHDDVPAAIEASGAACVYTRPIGADPEIPDLIAAALSAYADR